MFGAVHVLHCFECIKFHKSVLELHLFLAAQIFTGTIGTDWKLTWKDFEQDKN